MSKMQYEVAIPECYVWMTKDSKDRAKLFKRYVIGYLAKTHPDLRLVKIKGLVAICERKRKECKGHEF